LCRRKQISKYIKENPTKLSTGRTRRNCLQERTGPDEIIFKREPDKIVFKREPEEIVIKRELEEIFLNEDPTKSKEHPTKS
jgi:hypothetical protein